MKRTLLLVFLLLPTAILAQEKTKVSSTDETAAQKTDNAQADTESSQADSDGSQAQTGDDAKLTSVPGSKALGMSILGNQDAPKSLVIVPWKTSDLGDSPGIAPMLDDSRQPVDREVFMRALRYYDIREGKKP